MSKHKNKYFSNICKKCKKIWNTTIPADISICPTCKKNEE